MASTFSISCPLPLEVTDRVLLGHGSGGKLSAALLTGIFFRAFRSPVLARKEDQAVFDVGGERLAFTTDTFVVKPLFFPGGDIGSLAVHGTVNDLAMGGAEPLYLSTGFILEEGLDLDVLRKVVASMALASRATGAEIVTGDTKVVEKGCGDGLFINTAGIGLVRPGVDLSAANARPGDCVLVSGMLGDHGMAILSEREGIGFNTSIVSDSAPLHTLVRTILDAVEISLPDIRCMRDPTRGGLASTLNEIAATAGVGIELDETAIPVREEVRCACEMLGLDPLYVANEGKLVAIVSPDSAEAVLAAMRQHPLGGDAQLIGKVSGKHPGLVTVRTAFGTSRILDMLSGDQLPRIC